MKHITLLLSIIAFTFSCSKKTIDADILITNGIVYNGTDKVAGNPSISNILLRI